MKTKPEVKKERTTQLLHRAASTLKLALIVTVYFAICVTIILAIIGVQP